MSPTFRWVYRQDAPFLIPPGNRSGEESVRLHTWPGTTEERPYPKCQLSSSQKRWQRPPLARIAGK